MAHKIADAMRLAVRLRDQYGITADDTVKLLRCERALRRWAERECNGEIQRDEETGVPFRYVRKNYLVNARGEVEPVRGGFLSLTGPTRDMEAASIRVIDAILAQYPGLSWYHQTDPRGCTVYLYRESDLVEQLPMGEPGKRFHRRDIATCYNSHGVAVCA